MDIENRNEKQYFFNEIKGTIDEINGDTTYYHLTITVGHEKKRQVNLSMNKKSYDAICKEFSIGDFVAIQLFPTSKFLNTGKFYEIS